MKNNNFKRDEIKETKGYVSVSTRLPNIDATLLDAICKRENISPSAYIRDLITKAVKSPQRKFVSGKNIIRYDSTNNSFSWFVKLDSGEEVIVLSNLSEEFIKNLKQQIEEAVRYRNDWVHHIKPDSTDVPSDILGGKK